MEEISTSLANLFEVFTERGVTVLGLLLMAACSRDSRLQSAPAGGL